MDTPGGTCTRNISGHAASMKGAVDFSLLFKKNMIK